jgi:hypothetical protein
LTVVIHLELSQDPLIEVELSKFKCAGWSDEVQFAETAEQVSYLLWGDYGAILTLDEEQTSEKSALVVLGCDRENLR